MKNPIMYVVLNGGLKMSPGKAAAQAVHSAMLLNGNSKEDFLSDFRRTVIVLEAKNAMQLQNLAIYLDGADIDSDYYIDEGVNEVDAYSITALAAFVGDDEELRKVFEAFPLYGHSKSRKVEEAIKLIDDNLGQDRRVKNVKKRLQRSLDPTEDYDLFEMSDAFARFRSGS